MMCQNLSHVSESCYFSNSVYTGSWILSLHYLLWTWASNNSSISCSQVAGATAYDIIVSASTVTMVAAGICHVTSPFG